jgi:hypothetical protein
MRRDVRYKVVLTTYLGDVWTEAIVYSWVHIGSVLSCSLPCLRFLTIKTVIPLTTRQTLNSHHINIPSKSTLLLDSPDFFPWSLRQLLFSSLSSPEHFEARTPARAISFHASSSTEWAGSR